MTILLPDRLRSVIPHERMIVHGFRSSRGCCFELAMASLESGLAQLRRQLLDCCFLGEPGAADALVWARVQLPAHYSWGDSDAEIETKLVRDAFFARGRLLRLHFLDEIPEILRQRRTFLLCQLPTPEQPECSPVHLVRVSSLTITNAFRQSVKTRAQHEPQCWGRAQELHLALLKKGGLLAPERILRDQQSAS